MTVEKVREDLLRRMAKRQGLTVHKTRRRDPRALDFGTFAIKRDRVIVAGPGLSADDVEAFLTGDES